MGLEKGEAKDKTKAEERFVSNLIVKMGSITEQIVDVSGGTVEFTHSLPQSVNSF